MVEGCRARPGRAEEARRRARRSRREDLEVRLSELHQKEREKLAAERDAFSTKATKAEKYEALIKSEVESYEKLVGEAAKDFAHLAPEDRLPILKRFASLLPAGPDKANPTTAGRPRPAAPTIDVDAMSDDDRRAQVASLSHEERAIAAGAGSKPTPFGFRMPKK